MLIIPKAPLQRRQRPPYALIALVAISSLLYLLTARSDARALEGAIAGFSESGFVEMETPFYLAYLQQGREQARAGHFQEASGREQARQILQDLGYDQHRHRVAQTMVDTWGAGANANHRRIDHWLQQRSTLQDIIYSQTHLAYGLSKQEPGFGTTISYSFVHAGSLHVILGMLLLIACGVDLESRLGSARVIVIYLFSQLLGAVAFILAPLDETAILSGSAPALAGLCTVYLLLHWRSHSPFFFWFGPFSATLPVHATLPLILLVTVQSVAVISGQAGLHTLIAIGGGIVAGLIAFLAARKMGLLYSAKREEAQTSGNASDYLKALDETYQLIGSLRVTEARSALDNIVLRYGEDFDCAQLRYKLALLENDVSAERMEALMKKHPQNNRQRTVLAKLWREHPDLHDKISNDTLYHVAFELNTPKLLPKAEEIFALLRQRQYHPVALGALANTLAASFGKRGHVEKRKIYEKLARAYVDGGANAL